LEVFDILLPILFVSLSSFLKFRLAPTLVLLSL
jgi:hypothetical protein